MYTDKEEPKGYCKTNPHHPTKNHETHKYSRKPYLPLLQKKGFELRSSRADTISAQGEARAINLFNIGSTPHNSLTRYATHTNDKRAQVRVVFGSRHRACSCGQTPKKTTKPLFWVACRFKCGSKGIRTPDPLLVRQMLWTSWAMLPFFNAWALQR